MKLKNKKLLIFDFDGTLIDSGPDLAEALNYMLKKLGYATFSLETIHSWVGNGAQTLVKRALLGKTDIEDEIDETLFVEALDIFLKYYKENLCVKTVTYPDVKNTLTTLKNQGYKLAIVTNKPYDFIKPILEKLELLNLFELYIGGDSLSKKKPDPMPLLHICNKLDFKIEDSIMVGDSKNDILAANSANMQSIGVSYGYNYDEDIGIYDPTVVIHDFKDIKNILERINYDK
ncbi:MAG: phosphoglycolate phosphatase [Campylobacterota bacterium]|nr:phosphoglycolate phosphatase [Campylobacterota bacterium]